jgi:phage-related protein
MINDQSLYFVFNGKKSSDFNVWCSGDGLYRLPERDVEYIAVPGRNGDLAVDNGRWMNVEVTYSCFIPKHFREHYSDLVSWLASQKGYGRLEDARHPEFYWLARMDADVAPKMVFPDDSGTFTLTFNCKPQRFLKSGEIPVEIPCSPAASPASARRYWRLSSFSELMQNSILSNLTYDLYTSAEVNAMQFEIITIPDESADWLSSLGDVRESIEFRGINSDRFFAGLFSTDPLTAESQASVWVYDTIYGIDASQFGRQSTSFHYIVVQKSFGTEVYYNGRKIAQDETYQFGTLINPTRFEALPVLRIKLPHSMTGMAGATVYMVGAGQNGIALKLTEEMETLYDATITIDTELMDVYILPNDSWKGRFMSLNSSAKFYGNRITLASGENTIRLDPMIAGCEIVPRWWTI